MKDNKLFLEDFEHYVSNANGRQIKVKCPLCIERRSNKRDKSLSINTSTLEYHCHYCDAKGILVSRNEENRKTITGNENFYSHPKKEYVRPDRHIEIKDDMYSDSFIEYFKGRGISIRTLKEVGITEEIEWMPQYNGKKRCIAFNYFLDGELINTKFRTRQKDFKLVSGAELVPYNIDSIHPSKYAENEERSAYFVEGEQDCITYIECGYKHVVSCPNGASSNLEFLDRFIEDYFEPLDFIYISVDNDRKGMEFRHELLRRFGSDKCRIIEYPEPCKDINEVLMQYGKEAVIECTKKFVEIKPEGIQELVDVESSLDYLYRNGYEPGFKIDVPELDKLISFKVGLLAIVTGIPSHGKTYLLNYILIRLNILHDWKIAFFSPEFYPTHEHIGQIIETIGGKRFYEENYNDADYHTMKEYVCKNFYWIDPDDTDIESVLERAKYLVKRKGIKALVIDPFNSLTDKEKTGIKQDEYISNFLQKLRWFARKYGVIVFLVMHPIKQNKNENTGLYPVVDLYACKGAAEIYDKADIGITVWRNELENYCEVHVTKVKFRHLGEKGGTAFKFNINNGRFVSIGNAEELKKKGFDIRTFGVEWDNSNFVLNKIRKEQEKEPVYPTLEELNIPNYENNKDSDLPFDGEDNGCPF